jgi:hypothetical protein
MGKAKDWEMEQEERGWWSVPGKYVCAECFDEDFLKQFVKEHAEVSVCDYCGSTAVELTGDETALIAAPFDSVMEIIAEGLQSEWNDADNENIPYESAEGGYQGNIYQSYDLVWDCVSPGNDKVAQQIIDSLPDHAWVERNYWQLSKGQALWFGWQNFCEVVKHKNRYMFHLGRMKEQSKMKAAMNVADCPPSTAKKEAEQAVLQASEKAESQTSFSSEISGTEDSAEVINLFGGAIPWVREPIDPAELNEIIEEEQDGVSASRMLDAIGEAVEEVELVRELPARTKLFRGRVGPRVRPYRSARSLGPPPPSKAVANRMSPAGIPMFYGALDEYTAAAETLLRRLKRSEALNIGAFETTENFYILDLTNIPGIPSLFSPERYLRPTLGFLLSFVSDLSKPIKKDDRVHTEYVPTQIITEYFRYSFHRNGGPPIRGILYPSSRAKGGIACVLFFTRKESGALPTGEFTEPKKQWLRIVPHSPKVLRQKPRKRKLAPNPFATG